MKSLNKAIKLAGGASALGRAIGQKQNTICNWRKRGQVPAVHCIPIESALNGRVTRYQLRPDVYGIDPKKAAA